MTRAFHLALLFVVAVHCSGKDARAQAARTPDAWDKVLATVSLTRETTTFDFTDMANYGGGDFLLPFFHTLHRYPLRIPFYSQVLRSDALKAAPSAGDLVMTAAWRMGQGTRRTLIGDPLEKEMKAMAEPDALVKAIRALHKAAARPLSAEQEAQLAGAVAGVPADVAQNAALLLLTEARAMQWRHRALARFQFGAAGHDLQHVFDRLCGIKTGDREEWDDSTRELMHAIDLKYLLVGGTDLAIAADRATAALEKRTGTETFDFEWETPQGRILLRGHGDHEYSGDRPYLLTIDLGGNDTYYGGGATFSAAHPASALLDLGGNDRYLEHAALATTPVAEFATRKEGSPRPSFGGGVLGYGILIDSSGNDLYRSLKNTQGSGLHGVGVLHDRGGDDRYDGYTGAQGAANFGVGVLGDLGGNDEYRCFTTSQGFGGTMGSGFLVDVGEGNDLYDANDSVIDFPAPQDPKHNATLAQGMGYGRRADYSDGHSLAGGIGALIEGGGDNSFRCGIYGQGAGYWLGAGLLSAGAGNDTYHGVWYTQGAVAHFAVGVLWDSGGNDHYVATSHASQGLGHDFGTGFLIDDSGNDKYEAPGLSVGSGNNNGFGFFWDKAGDDDYTRVRGTSLTFGTGRLEPAFKNSIRERNPSLGIFLDSGGNDSYPPKLARTGNNTSWLMPREETAFASQLGAGLDLQELDLQ